VEPLSPRGQHAKRPEPADDLFTLEEHERARRYHRPLYPAVAARLLLVVAAYGLLAGHAIAGLGWAGDAAAWAATVVITVTLVCLPLDLWRGYLRERSWGLSTQTLHAWLIDRTKSTGVAVLLVAALWTALVGLGRALPHWWPAVAAGGAALAVLVVTLLAPMLLEPLFNRFRPLPDGELARSLRALADDAGVPLRQVLVADASRRTVKSNAYVSGLGPTRRLVLWDTLLSRASPAEVRLVVAHELAHQRERHVLKGTVLAMAGAVVAVLLLRVVLGTPQPGDYPLAALLVVGLEVAGSAPGAALSRSFERAADRISLELTGDRDAFAQTHLALARTNLADLDPPRLAYLTLFTHPTAPERIAMARADGANPGSGTLDACTREQRSLSPSSPSPRSPRWRVPRQRPR
jgi:Zn-dependent protease with chaperone function